MKKLLVGFLSAMFVGVFALGALQGCKSSEKVATRIALQYGVGKYLDKQSPESRVEKARAVVEAVRVLNELAGADVTTVDALRAYIATRISDLPPTDRRALGDVIDLATEVLKERVGSGVLNPEGVLVVRDVLSWVDEVAASYVPPAE